MSDAKIERWPQTEEPLNRWGWLRFSILSLLGATALAGLPFAWFRRRLVAARAQAEVVTRLESLGASIGYVHEWDDATDRRSTRPPPGPAWLRAMLGDHFFFTPDLILLTDFDGDQRELAIIEQLTTVRHLGVCNSKVDDGLISSILPLTRIEYLTLYGTGITDHGLAQLAALPNLRSVVVTYTTVTELGIERFKAMRPTCDVYSTDED